MLNEIEIIGDYVKVYLNTARAFPKFALIDLVDLPLVSSRSWYPIESGYICANTSYRDHKAGKRRYRSIYLHRLILNAQKGQEVDHVNGDIQDCRRANLRFATKSQNAMNRMPLRGKKYKGVILDKRNNRYNVRVNSKSYKMYHSEVEAALHYDVISKKLFKEFQRPNFPHLSEAPHEHLAKFAKEMEDALFSHDIHVNIRFYPQTCFIQFNSLGANMIPILDSIRIWDRYKKLRYSRIKRVHLALEAIASYSDAPALNATSNNEILRSL